MYGHDAEKPRPSLYKVLLYFVIIIECKESGASHGGPWRTCVCTMRMNEKWPTISMEQFQKKSIFSLRSKKQNGAALTTW